MIVFTKPINEDKLRMAYNNDVIRFHSDGEALPLYCDISAPGIDIRLYPAPDNTFFYNFKPVITTLINTRNFEDTLETGLQASEAQSFLYDAAEGAFLEKEVTITIALDNNTADAVTHTLSWLAGVEQLEDHNSFHINSLFVMAPLEKLATNKAYLKYWQGYPFDFSIYNVAQQLDITNNTNLLSQSFDVAARVSRLFVSDGRTDESLEDVLPMPSGYNHLILDNGVTDIFYLTLEKIPYKCGAYFKWLNKYGGYSYWLFENTFSVDRSTKQLGELDRDFSNLENTFTRAIQIGKESQDTMRAVAELLTDNERRIVEGLLESPKIYLFTGQPYSRSFAHNWVEVSLKTGGARIRNPKQDLTNFIFDFELPQRYTQTL